MWQGEMVAVLRHMIGDIEEPFTYSDLRLEEIIAAAGQLMLTEVSLDNSYTIQASPPEIVPDPTELETKDNLFINLALLKAGCIIDTCEARLAASQGVSIADGSSRISLSGKLTGKLRMWERGYCAGYERALDLYNKGKIGEVGAMITGPYRTTGSYPTPYPIDGRYR